jgi:hypothetical protein
LVAIVSSTFHSVSRLDAASFSSIGEAKLDRFLVTSRISPVFTSIGLGPDGLNTWVV